MCTENSSSHFGTIVLAGKPNTGKSTLLNAIVGQKLAIVSPKPQSTRTSVMGLHTEGHCQLLFVDPPGLLEPSGIMQESMFDDAVQALNAASAVLMLHPVNEGPPPQLESLVTDFKPGSRPVATVLTKADLLANSSPPSASSPVFLVSEKTSQGISELLDWCRLQAPPGEFRYDPEDIGTQPLRFFVAELVREAAFEALDQELPYAMAALVEEFRENTSPVYIRVSMYVERESQKGMVIGKGGATIKSIGSAARAKVEELLGEPVYLDLWVNVLSKWRRSPKMLKMFGMTVAPENGKRSK